MHKQFFEHYSPYLGVFIYLQFESSMLVKVLLKSQQLERNQVHAGLIPKHVSDAFSQIKQYLEGHRKQFKIEKELAGSSFQKSIWAKLEEIPYGKTTTYGKLAAQLGNVKKVRAVGAAIGQNPLPLVIPCHRVLGARGELRGYIGGLDVKKKLLKLEKERK